MFVIDCMSLYFLITLTDRKWWMYELEIGSTSPGIFRTVFQCEQIWDQNNFNFIPRVKSECLFYQLLIRIWFFPPGDAETTSLEILTLQRVQMLAYLLKKKNEDKFNWIITKRLLLDSERSKGSCGFTTMLIFFFSLNNFSIWRLYPIYSLLYCFR